MAPIWSRQPFTALYTVFVILEAMVTMPLIMLRSIFKSARPHPEWSYKMSALTPVFRRVFTWQANTRSFASWDAVMASHEKTKERCGRAEPGAANLYCGVLAPGEAVPAPVAGLWYPAPPPAEDIENARVVLHFPGGAMTLAFGEDSWGQTVSKPYLNFSDTSYVFYAQYRVSRDESTRFPAALQDVVTFYNYILSLGVRPSNIVVGGDSAGGNLAIAFSRYLEDPASKPANLPLPKGIMVFSPWALVTRRAGADYEGSRNSQIDYLAPPLLDWGAEAYFPKDKEPTAQQMAYISPLHHPFQTKVPLFINSCAAEGFFDFVQELAAQMGKVEGNRIRWHPTEHLPHDLMGGWEGFGWEKEVKVAVEDAFRFFEA